MVNDFGADFLFELGCEELPSASVLPLAQALANNFIDIFAKSSLSHEKVSVFATPRRIAVHISDLSSEQASTSTIMRGPALSCAYDACGQPTTALYGFIKSKGISFDDLSRIKTDKGEWLAYELIQPNVNTSTLLPGIVKQALLNLPIAKPMRWGSQQVEFVRPVHWALILLGDVPIFTEILGIKTGSCSYGHRFHCPQFIKIAHPKEYAVILRDAFVIADFAKRRVEIVKQVRDLALSKDAQVIMPDELLDEVTSIVEWPQALIVPFESRFLSVPAEVLIAVIQSHQKCFALKTKLNQLLPYFITVANIASLNTNQVVAGNERVMAARLSDASFFFNEDRKKALCEYFPITEKVSFSAQLGSLADKARRLQVLMAFLSPYFGFDINVAQRAAFLSKCDLMTGMVGELPELQGVMGYYYAIHDGESEEVAFALKEQYLPRFSGDSLPSSPLGLALSLAERIDTLVGIFATCEKPTGVKDPFKLRRHALAIVRILISMDLPFSLTDLLAETYQVYAKTLASIAFTPMLLQLQLFIGERLQSYYNGQGITADLLEAVHKLKKDNLYDFHKRLEALLLFVKLPQAKALVAASKRIGNLLQIAEVSQNLASVTVSPDESEPRALASGFPLPNGHFSDSSGEAMTRSQNLNILLRQELLENSAEKVLFKQIEIMEESVMPFYMQKNYTEILMKLTSLAEPLNDFFEKVLVMVDNEDLKNNRLALLKRLQFLLEGVACISVLRV